MSNLPPTEPTNFWHAAWIVPVALVVGVVLLVVGAIALFIGAFVVDDMKKKVKFNPPAPPSPPAVRVNTPAGGFRPTPTTVPTQPSFDEAIRKARDFNPPGTQPRQ